MTTDCTDIKSPTDRRKSFTLKTPFGTLDVRGYDIMVIFTIMLGCCMAIFIWFNTKEHAAIFGELMKQTSAIEEQTYVLTLTPEQRNKLDIEMPESLRKKTGRNR
jgi:Na+/melibiose symporter-like transporter